ncbi:MAG: hypothetical protein AB8G77_27555 [Rhodothermales bacterium]
MRIGVLMGSFLCRILTVALLVGALANFAVVFKSSPAFNGNERLESVVGGWRVLNSASHYDKAEYQLELAYGYLNELGLALDPETGKMGLIDVEEMNARTSKAIELLDQVILLDPANASAWAYLAQAHSRNGEFDAMRENLNRSWALAPNNLQLAPLRLSLVMMIEQVWKNAPENAAPLSDDEIASAHRDGAVLQASSPRYLAVLAKRSETVQKILDGLEQPESTSS